MTPEGRPAPLLESSATFERSKLGPPPVSVFLMHNRPGGQPGVPHHPCGEAFVILQGRGPGQGSAKRSVEGGLSAIVISPALRAASPTAAPLATGFSRGFLVAAEIGLLALAIAIASIRVRCQDLTGTRPAPDQDAASQPATVRHDEDRVALAAAGRPCRHC